MKKAKKISLISFKVLSACCFAFVLTLISQELISFGAFSFVFLMLSVGLAGFYLVKDMNFIELLILSASLVLLALLLRFYVILAYGS